MSVGVRKDPHLLEALKIDGQDMVHIIPDNDYSVKVFLV